MQNPEYNRALEAASIARSRGNLEDEAKLLRYAASIQPQEELVAGNTLKEVSIPSMGPNGQVVQSSVLVPKTAEEMAATRARNLQISQGLADPVVVPEEESMGMKQRFLSSFASTRKDKEAYYKLEYGDNNFLHLGNERYLVKTTDKDGKSKWVVDDPVGLDFGDVVALTGSVPSLISGITTALAYKPGPAGTAASLMKVSGASALASQSVGAIQDILFRFGTDQPIDTPEIIGRRAPQVVAEFAGGVLVPMVAGKVASKAAERGAVKRYYNEINKAGEAAEERLREAGITPSNSSELGQIIRESNPMRQSAAKTGDDIAQFVSDQDNALRKESTKAFEEMTGEVATKFNTELNKRLPENPLTPLETGNIAQSRARQIYEDSKKAIGDLYDAGYQQINQALAASGEKGYKRTNFIDLANTRKFISDFNKETSLVKVTPESKTVVPGRPVGFTTTPETVVTSPEAVEVIGARSAVDSILNPITEAKDSLQKISAVRYQRSRLGEFLNGRTDLFPGLDTNTANRLYGALSEDISMSLNKLTGPGADLMRKADSEYRALVEPINQNKFIQTLVNGRFESGEQVIDAMSRASNADWQMLERVLGTSSPKLYNQIRRSVADAVKKNSTVTVFGNEVTDVAKFASSLRAMDPDIRRTIFGKELPALIDGLGTRYEGLMRSRDIFTMPTLPTEAQIAELQDVGRLYGLDKMFRTWNDMVNVVQRRNDSLAESLLSLANNRSTGVVTADINQVLQAIIFNDRVNSRQVGNFLGKLPRDFKINLGDAVFDNAFERSRANVFGQVKAGVYDAGQMERLIFGNKERQAVITDLIGDQRMQRLKDWVDFERRNAIRLSKSSRSSQAVKDAARIAALTPYPNLQAAQVSSMAFETAAGGRFLKGANPDRIVAFPEARRILLLPTKSRADIAFIQQAINNGTKEAFDDYNEMMDQFTPEQQTAINQYLFNPQY